MIVVVMGVTGCGKSTVGAALAARLGWRFIEGDEFHPEGNVEKMASGMPLTDEDRWPWLDRLADEMRAVEAAGDNAVVACSALKEAYRARFAPAGDVRFVHLAGDEATIAARLARRRHRYMPASLLASQFATLERPASAVTVDIRMPVDRLVDAICAALAPPAAQGASPP
ncbi:gluconokinase [Burkholderiales bacterium]|nr:gluconokinase [Burkholderiales bacterium]